MLGAPSRTIRIVATAVAILIVMLLVGGYLVRASVQRALAGELQLRSARALASDALQYILDEETGIRGYAVTHDRVLLEPYVESRPKLVPALARLETDLRALGLDPLPAQRARQTGALWDRAIAHPILASAVASPRSRRDLERIGKSIVDRFRRQIDLVDRGLDERERDLDAQARASLDRVAVLSLAAIAGVVLVTFAFLRRQAGLEIRLEHEREAAASERLAAAQLRVAYEAEKRIADTLQDAIAQRPLPLHPSLRFSATYVPATEETKVGGDWYDAIELPANRVLFAIGDVTGHGLNAAVTMSRARQALVVSALLDSDPASVLQRVNVELTRQQAPMVTAVAGFADARTYEFVYASAGHPPPVLVEPNRPPRMLDFGGVPLGVIESAKYRTHRIQSVPGAMLVLYTDGAVEHTRDVVEGETILLDSISRAADGAVSDPARSIHANIFGGNPVGDDVAILTIGFGETQHGALEISADSAETSITSRIARDGTPASLAEARRIRAARQALRKRAS